MSLENQFEAKFANIRRSANMLEKKHLRPGVLIWWERNDRLGTHWSCPCIVTKVGRKSFRVRSLDDFKETGELRMNDSIDRTSRREMRVCTMEEVEGFFERRTIGLGKKVRAAKVRLRQSKQELDTYTNKIKEFFEETKKAA